MLTLTPEQRAELNALDDLAEAIGKVFPTADLDLQPTSRACMLAAQAALAVIQAHELGQEVTHPETVATTTRSNGHKSTCPECGKLISPTQMNNHRKKKHDITTKT